MIKKLSLKKYVCLYNYLNSFQDHKDFKAHNTNNAIMHIRFKIDVGMQWVKRVLCFISRTDLASVQRRKIFSDCVNSIVDFFVFITKQLKMAEWPAGTTIALIITILFCKLNTTGDTLTNKQRSTNPADDCELLA